MAVTTFIVRKTAEISETVGMVQLPISRTDGQKGKSGMCIQVPAVSNSVWELVYADQIGKAWMIDQIDALRSRIASSINKAGKPITSDAIGITALLAAMKAEGESQRLTREAVLQWFDAVLAAPLADRLATLFPAADYKTLAKKLALQREQFDYITARNGCSEEIKARILRCLEFVPAESSGNDALDALTARITEKALELKPPMIEVMLVDVL